MEKESLSRETLKTVKICFLLAGTLLILLALLSSSFTASSDHPIVSRTVIAILGAISVSAGLVVGTQKGFFVNVSKFMFSVLIAFLIAEFLGITGLFLFDRLAPDGEIDPKAAVLKIHSGVYRPYVLWRANPFSGDSVTIRENGLRSVPGASSDSTAVQVFVFGGSTIVGWQTNDSTTICAHIQNGLTDTSERPVCVTNFGQQGYVNTQQLIELQLQIRAGNVPDLVIFYDGTNEVWSAFVSDTAGIHFNYQEIADLYENRNFTRNEFSSRYGILQLAGELNSVNLLKTILGKKTDTSVLSLFEAEPSRCMLQGEDFVDPAEFAEEIMGIYEGDLRILRALSNEFGFEYRVFWQPVVVIGNKHLTSEEQEIYDMQVPFLLSLYKDCETIAIDLEERYDCFFCITDVFDNVDETLYLDICHLNALGDSLVAEKILKNLPGV